MQAEDEDKMLRLAALQNVQSILQARQRAEQELLNTKEKLEEETSVLELLNTTGAMLASNLDLQSVVQAVTDAATKVSGAQFGAFFYTNKNAEGDVFTLYTLSGAPREAFAKFGHPRATPIFAPTFQGEGPIRLEDVTKDPRYGQWAPHRGMPPGHLPVRSYLAVPVIGRTGEVIGGLFFGHSEPNVFTARSERVVVGIAGQASIAIDNARMYESAKAAAEERARLLDAERLSRLEIERVSLMKDEFLATLSHELRTPLNAVLGWSELMLTRPCDDRTRRGLETIARNARAQGQLIEDLLDMNRMVSGKLRLEVQQMELEPTVDAALESVRPSTEAKAITVHKTIDPYVGPLFGDPNRIQQVIWNLLSNAVKFTPKGGQIDLKVQRVSSHIEIIVKDNGTGMSAEFLPQLFQRFRQADSSSTRKYGGLGLGLSIVKHLVELHGGSVRAQSEGEGFGATLIVSLPQRASLPSDPPRRDPTSQRFAPLQTAVVSLAGVKVLVVDDEADARELLLHLLTDAQAEVVIAASADEALVLLKSMRPDVLVSDLGMPGRDGYQLIRDVRALPRREGGRTPAIALTAFARSEDRTRAMLAGYQVHASKPVEPRELIAMIRSLASNSEEDDE